MSERGSFVTEYVYCDKCFEHLKILLSDEKYLKSTQIEGWTGLKHDLPIIAGKIGGLYDQEEIDSMRDMLNEIEDKLCHEIRVCVLAEGGEKIFKVGKVRK